LKPLDQIAVVLTQPITATIMRALLRGYQARTLPELDSSGRQVQVAIEATNVTALPDLNCILPGGGVIHSSVDLIDQVRARLARAPGDT
jgi:hypothetical protein